MLTNEMRRWLGAQPIEGVLLYDFVHAFMRQFDLDPTAAGRAIGQWIEETA